MFKNRSWGRVVARVIFAVTASAILAGGLMPAHAALVVNGVNMFRDTRGPNDVGAGSGDRIQYGGNIVGGSANGRFAGVNVRWVESIWYAPEARRWVKRDWTWTTSYPQGGSPSERQREELVSFTRGGKPPAQASQAQRPPE